MRLHGLDWVYTCQNDTLLEITCHGSIYFLSAVVNVARDKPAEQKRGYAGYFTWGADKAVDGCYQRDDPENEECCSASILDLNFDDPSDNYWRVNLTQLYQVESIVIYARLGM